MKPQLAAWFGLRIAVGCTSLLRRLSILIFLVLLLYCSPPIVLLSALPFSSLNYQYLYSIFPFAVNDSALLPVGGSLSNSHVGGYDDSPVQRIALPFPFHFYSYYTSLILSQNGVVFLSGGQGRGVAEGGSVENTGGESACCSTSFDSCFFGNGKVPTTKSPGNQFCNFNNSYDAIIAPCLVDLNPSAGGGLFGRISYFNRSASDPVIIRWDTVPLFYPPIADFFPTNPSDPTVPFYTFSLTIFPDSSFLFKYFTISDPAADPHLPSIAAAGGNPSTLSSIQSRQRFLIGARSIASAGELDVNATRLAEWQTSRPGVYPPKALMKSNTSVLFCSISTDWCMAESIGGIAGNETISFSASKMQCMNDSFQHLFFCRYEVITALPAVWPFANENLDPALFMANDSVLSILYGSAFAMSANFSAQFVSSSPTIPSNVGVNTVVSQYFLTLGHHSSGLHSTANTVSDTSWSSFPASSVTLIDVPAAFSPAESLLSCVTPAAVGILRVRLFDVSTRKEIQMDQPRYFVALPPTASLMRKSAGTRATTIGKDGSAAGSQKRLMGKDSSSRDAFHTFSSVMLPATFFFNVSSIPALFLSSSSSASFASAASTLYPIALPDAASYCSMCGASHPSATSSASLSGSAFPASGYCARDCLGVYSGVAGRDQCGVCASVTSLAYGGALNCQDMCFAPQFFDAANCECAFNSTALISYYFDEYLVNDTIPSNWTYTQFDPTLPVGRQLCATLYTVQIAATLDTIDDFRYLTLALQCAGLVAAAAVYALNWAKDLRLSHEEEQEATAMLMAVNFTEHQRRHNHHHHQHSRQPTQSSALPQAQPSAPQLAGAHGSLSSSVPLPSPISGGAVAVTIDGAASTSATAVVAAGDVDAKNDNDDGKDGGAKDEDDFAEDADTDDGEEQDDAVAIDSSDNGKAEVDMVVLQSAADTATSSRAASSHHKADKAAMVSAALPAQLSPPQPDPPVTMQPQSQLSRHSKPYTAKQLHRSAHGQSHVHTLTHRQHTQAQLQVQASTPANLSSSSATYSSILPALAPAASTSSSAVPPSSAHAPSSLGSLASAASAAAALSHLRQQIQSQALAVQHLYAAMNQNQNMMNINFAGLPQPPQHLHHQQQQQQQQQDQHLHQQQGRPHTHQRGTSLPRNAPQI